MRILYTVAALPPSIGGVQVHVHQVALRLARQHQVQVAGQWDRDRRDWLRASTVLAPGPARRTEATMVVQRLGMPPATRLRMLPWAATYYAQIRRSADRIAALMLPQLAQAVGPVDIVHNHRVGREFLSMASERLARQLGVPFVLTPHHHPRWSAPRYRNYLELYRRADLVCAMTQAEAAILERSGVDPSRILVVGNAPDLAASPDGTRFRERYGLNGHPIVLFLGQKYPYKGLATLLDAAPRVWANHPDVRFVFMGPRTRYSKRLLRRHDPRVLELGPSDREAKSDALSAADIVCVPSSQEALGIVYLEAWALGKPIIACRIPALTELVDHDGDGLLVSPENVSELEAALQRLLSSAELRQALGARGREKVARRFSWDRCAALQAEAYERLTARSHGTPGGAQDARRAGVPGEGT